MKRILTAAFALSLMAGASAFAQDQAATPMPAAPAADAAPAASMPSTDQTAPAPAATDAQPAAPMAPAAPGMADQTGAAPSTMANAPAGSPPSSYPMCTHKGEDRCQQRGGSEDTKMSKHHMTKHVMTKHTMHKTHAKAASAEAAPAAPAATPAQ